MENCLTIKVRCVDKMSQLNAFDVGTDKTLKPKLPPKDQWKNMAKSSNKTSNTIHNMNSHGIKNRVYANNTYQPHIISGQPNDQDGSQLTRLPEGKLIRSLMEMDEFNRNLDEYKDRLSTYAFAMFRYKTSW